MAKAFLMQFEMKKSDESEEMEEDKDGRMNNLEKLLDDAEEEAEMEVDDNEIRDDEKVDILQDLSAMD
jgi:hypothetical protein